MSAVRHGAAVVCATAALGFLSSARPPSAQTRVRVDRIAAASPQALRDWDAITSSMLRSGELRIRQTRDDTLLPGQVTERADQYFRGVRVFGGDIARQLDAQGTVLSIFGSIYPGIDIATGPALDETAVRARVAALAGQAQADAAAPELVVLPRDDGSGFSLAWRMRAITPAIDAVEYFLDAANGDVLLQYSDRESQSAVGRATGVLGDSK